MSFSFDMTPSSVSKTKKIPTKTNKNHLSIVPEKTAGVIDPSSAKRKGTDGSVYEEKTSAVSSTSRRTSTLTTDAGGFGFGKSKDPKKVNQLELKKLGLLDQNGKPND